MLERGSARVRDFGCGELHTVASAGYASVHYYRRTAAHPDRVEHAYPSHSIVFTDLGEWLYHGSDKASTISEDVVVAGIGQRRYSCAHASGVPNVCFVVAVDDVAFEDERTIVFPSPTVPLTPEMLALRRAIVRAVDEGDEARTESLAFSLYEIASRASSRPTRVPPTDVRMVYAKKLIRDRSALPTTVADIARELDLSRFTFTRRFLTAAGVTPHQFMTRIRIERAKEQLRRTKWPIEQIALANGFGSTAHFSHAFRATVGVTPTSYRVRL